MRSRGSEFIILVAGNSRAIGQAEAAPKHWVAAGGVAPTSLPFFQGTRFGAAGAGFSFLAWSFSSFGSTRRVISNVLGVSGVRLLRSNRRHGRRSWQRQLTPSGHFLANHGFISCYYIGRATDQLQAGSWSLLLPT